MTNNPNSPATEAKAPEDDLQLSIIIVSYNTSAVTAACLNSIKESNLKLSYEVFVVDNASSDQSPERIEREFPWVKLIRNSENLMFAKANNQAIKLARGRQVMLLNSDTLVRPGTFEKLYDFIEAHRDKIGCVGPRVLNSDGTLQSEGEPFDSYAYVWCSMLLVEKLPLPLFIKNALMPEGYPRWQTGQARKVGWVRGCAMMIPRAVLAKTGGLDEEFNFYCEEIEYCYRLRKFNLETWVVPDSELVHFGSESVKASYMLDSSHQPHIPNYFTRRLMCYEKTIGVERKISINKLRLFLCRLMLPLVMILRPRALPALREKISLHDGENINFRKLMNEKAAKG